MQDFDHDGRLSFDDYSQAVDADTLLLEVLGQCLPDTKVSIIFYNQLNADVKRLRGTRFPFEKF